MIVIIRNTERDEVHRAVTPTTNLKGLRIKRIEIEHIEELKALLHPQNTDQAKWNQDLLNAMEGRVAF